MLVRNVVEYLARQAKYALLVLRNPRLYAYEGVQVPLRATPELQNIRRTVYDGGYERAEIEAIRQLIKPDDVVLELGSGCGIVSSFIAKHLSDSRNLHTFEANPRLLDSIRAVSAANGLAFNLSNAAVGFREGEAEFFFDDNFLSSSFYDRQRSATKTKVKVVAIADLLERIRPTFIVFDIEGAEADVLNVAIPSQVRVLCGEVHPNIIGDHAVSTVIQNIMNQGFDLLVDQSQGRAVAFARAEPVSNYGSPSCRVLEPSENRVA